MKNVNNVQRLILLLAICAAITIAGVALAAGEVFTRSVVTSAGGQDTVNGIESRSAIGQPVAGILTSGGNGGVCVGFLCPGSGSEQGMPEITPTATPDGTLTATPDGTVTNSPTLETTVTPGETLTPDPLQTPSATPDSTVTPASTASVTSIPGTEATPTPSSTPSFGGDTNVYLPLVKNGS